MKKNNKIYALIGLVGLSYSVSADLDWSEWRNSFDDVMHELRSEFREFSHGLKKTIPFLSSSASSVSCDSHGEKIGEKSGRRVYELVFSVPKGHDVEVSIDSSNNRLTISSDYAVSQKTTTDENSVSKAVSQSSSLTLGLPEGLNYDKVAQKDILDDDDRKDNGLIITIEFEEQATKLNKRKSTKAKVTVS